MRGYELRAELEATQAENVKLRAMLGAWRDYATARAEATHERAMLGQTARVLRGEPRFETGTAPPEPSDSA